jgi:hypothetical protein
MMQNITLRSYVSTDRMLHIDIPVMAFNTEVEVVLTIKPTIIPKPFPMTCLEEGLGCVKYEGKAKSLEEMEEGITKAARQQWFNEVKT